MHSQRIFLRVFSLAAAVLSLTACGAAPSDSSQNDPIACSLLLSGQASTVYLTVSDEALSFYDQAGDGQLIASAAYPQPMAGAAEALEEFDLTDLDEDGNSDLSARFRFPDDTSANLLWFYSDGGFAYNEEFSVLPGETPLSGEDPAPAP